MNVDRAIGRRHQIGFLSGSAAAMLRSAALFLRAGLRGLVASRGASTRTEAAPATGRSRSEARTVATYATGGSGSVKTTDASSRNPWPAGESIDRQGGRLKVLITAYSCSPGRGSEPGIGWNTARGMANEHDVWVLTRTRDAEGRSHREAIEAELAERPIPSLHFLYYDLPGWLRRILGIQWSSYVWQLMAQPIARRAHEEIGFDLGHHVSWVRYYTPSMFALLPIPYVWGPVGGGEALPRSFRKQLSFGARLAELQRRILGALAVFDPLVRMTARKAALTLANSRETAERVASLGATNVRIFGESGIDSWIIEVGKEDPPAPTREVYFASMTRLVYWKGVHLGLEAFAQLGDVDAVYWIVGDGPERQHLEALAKRLGIADRVEFHSGLSRSEWMERLRRCDALVHPCIYNSGSAISLEAMAMGKPVICLDRGGIRNQVSDEIGYRIRAESPAEAISGMKRAMNQVIDHRDLAAEKGRLAQERVQLEFSWTVRASMMNEIYADALGNPVDRPAVAAGATRGIEHHHLQTKEK